MGSRIEYSPEIIYKEIPLKAQRWMSAIRIRFDKNTTDYENEMVMRLVAILYWYLERRTIPIPKTPWDHWKHVHRFRSWYPLFSRLLGWRDPEMVDFDARAVFPELHVLEDRYNIKYCVREAPEPYQWDDD